VYAGISHSDRRHRLNGKVVYHPDIDVHFPSLTVEETVQFAARSRPTGNQANETIAQATRSICSDLGLTGALGTKIGNAVIPGVSGGERKRTSIAVCEIFFSLYRRLTMD